jgi:hypothetical protein
MPTEKNRTLKLERPFGRTLILSLAILAGLVAAAELLLRWEPLQSRLPYPSFGNNSHQLDIKLHLLDKMAERDGPPDCLFLGNSMVQAGIDPDAFNETYREITGHTLRCFNFGVLGMAPYAGATLIRILNRNYSPKMVIWGISPYDLKTNEKNKQLALEDGSWIRFQTGEGNFGGWLIDASYLTRYYLRFRLWLDFPRIDRVIRASERRWSANGFTRGRRGSSIAAPDQLEREAENKGAMRNFKINQRVLSRMHEAFQSTPGVTCVLVEMPIHRSNEAGGEEEEKSYEKLVSLIQGFAGRKNIHFIQSDRQNSFNDSHWRNFLHMNSIGARRFSQWLGRRVGAAVRQGVLPDPRRSRRRP